MKKLRCIFPILIILFFGITPSLTSNDSTLTISKLRLMADEIIKNTTFQFVDSKNGTKYISTQEIPSGVSLSLESRYNDWRYWNGIFNIAMIRLGEFLHDSTYGRYAEKNIAFAFDNYKYFERAYKNEGKWNYPFGQRFIMEELDDCGAMGASVIEVYQKNGEKRLKQYIDEAANHILKKQTRLNDRTFVRSFPQKWTLWADDLYMGLSFLSRMGKLTGENKYFDDAASQIINYHKYLFSEQAGAMYHCWYSDVNRNGVAFWGRANGWALLAQIDLLATLPKNHPKRDTLIALLQRHIIGISRYQGSDGLWHQLLDKQDSYLETSCSAMFTYAIAYAVNNGLIEKRYSTIALRGWEGIMNTIHSDGQVEGVCTGTVVSDDLVYYYHRPAPLNDVHGLGTVLLAGIEVLGLSK